MELLSVIVRTMPGREHFLDQCLFSLSVQHYRPIQVIVVVQLPDGDADVEGLLKPLYRIIHQHGRFLEDIVIKRHTATKDERSRALNIGISEATGRFIAFLDDDDVVYPEHYTKLIDLVQRSGRVWAYSGTARAIYRRQEKDIYLVQRDFPFRSSDYSFVEHLRDNFIPIHSFLVDRSRVDVQLRFDENLIRLEDYEFLLRLARYHEPGRVPAVTCEYRIWNDGSNSVLDGTDDAKARAEKRQIWERANQQLYWRKHELIGWWVGELLENGVSSGGSSTQVGVSSPYQSLVDMYWDSTSWAITAPIRRAIQSLRGIPKEQRPVVQSYAEAKQIVEAIERSTSWRIAAPVRFMGKILRH
ncbi:glycosyltransferase family 2 protein [Kyrpidia tusciae]|uniref:glycosyltransferase family 2 protein n=1 Tax=Kyrpidia tusciae TaxID=33943 RepID=UPI0002E9400C|nr:glycosyltransferase family A protein [Kyrpidia tusciae]